MMTNAIQGFNKPLSEERAIYLRRVEVALERAFLQPKETARRTNTHLVVQRNGQLLKLKANEL